MGILHRKVTDFNSTFSSVLVPKVLIKYLSHELYYFLTMRKTIHKYVRTFKKCQMNLQKPNYINLNQEIAQTPQDHLLVDLIGPYNTTTQGNIYAFTAICSLTCHPMTTLIPDKKTSTIAVHLFLEIFLKFGFPRILHSDNGTEFKLKLIEHLT